MYLIFLTKHHCFVYRVMLTKGYTLHTLTRLRISLTRVLVCCFISSVNMATAALFAADEGLHVPQYRCWAISQFHYALGNKVWTFSVHS